MRIVIDLQGAQTGGSRHRGIGRYSLWLAQAMVRNRGPHEILIALSDHFPETVDAIRAEFDGLLCPSRILVWRALERVSGLERSCPERRIAAEHIREAFLASLRPDFLLVTSLFEGLVDDAITSIGALTGDVPTAVVLYDLIPHVHRSRYLAGAEVRAWYDNKLDSLRRAGLALAISESSRREGIDHLGLDPLDCVSISAATDPRYQVISVDPNVEQQLRRRLELTREFVLYTGGIDHRKNIEGSIRAFARLPDALRARYQLAVVCSIQPHDRERLSTLAAQHGLEPGDLILTGFVSGDDLLLLYNLCSLFVFPSWHEGFGLPALEAMSCGRAVIAAGTSSLPEVIGRADALFDPHDDGDIAALMERVLTDDELRLDLEQHGRIQAKGFSWDLCAERAIAAMEDWRSRHLAEPKMHKAAAGIRRPRLAYVSPLPPERSGISDYSAELLPELSRHYRIDVIVAQAEVQDDWVQANCDIRSVDWFRKHAKDYDRVLYQFGNSEFHTHMFPLLREIPGVVTLHDFFLSGAAAHVEWGQGVTGTLARRLQNSTGYAAVVERYAAADAGEIVMRYPANLEVLQLASGIIVHSAVSLRFGRQWYGEEAVADWRIIPHLRSTSLKPSRSEARHRLGIALDELLVCSFGMVAPTKLSAELQDAWLESGLASRPDCALVFVGGGTGSPYADGVAQRCRQAPDGSRMHVTGWVDQATYRDYLAAADIAVQLRTASRGETSGAVLDCMGSGIPIIVNANGSMADLNPAVVKMLPDDFARAELVEVLEELAGSPNERKRLGTAAREFVATEHHPRLCAARYRDALESIYQQRRYTREGLYQELGRLAGSLLPEEVTSAAQSIALNQPLRPRRRQLLLDISGLAHGDASPETEPILRGILQHWLLHPPLGLQVEPVYTEACGDAFRYARRFALQFLDCPTSGFEDHVVEYAPGDVFLGLDLSLCRPAPKRWLGAARRAGVDVRYLVSDLLPVQHPEFFPDGAAANLREWLHAVGESNGAICTSRSTAENLISWMQCFGPERVRPLPIDLLTMGIDRRQPQADAVAGDVRPRLLQQMRRTPSFLLTACLEPRQYVGQALDAFELLWNEEIDVQLVIVGRQGWKGDSLAHRIRCSADLGRRLFWIEENSPALLTELRDSANCILLTGIGESIALPLLDAAQSRKPVLARDTPASREVAGPAASFFSGAKGIDLATAIKKWLKASSNVDHAKAPVVDVPCWEDTARSVEMALVSQAPHRTWMRDGSFRYWGNDPRMHTQVGRPQGRGMAATGAAGFLLYGPYQALPMGQYEVTLHGVSWPVGQSRATMDVTVNRGLLKLVEAEVGTAFEYTTGPRTLLARVSIDLHEACEDLEVRVWVGSGSSLVVEDLAITPRS